MLAHFLDEASPEQRFIEHVDNVYRHDGPKNPDQGQCGHITSQNYGWTQRFQIPKVRPMGWIVIIDEDIDGFCSSLPPKADIGTLDIWHCWTHFQ